MSVVHEHGGDVEQSVYAVEPPEESPGPQLGCSGIRPRDQDEEMGDRVEFPGFETKAGTFNVRNSIRNATHPINQDIARGMLSFPRNMLPFPSDYNFTLPTHTPDATKSHLKAILDKLDLDCQYDASTVTGFAHRNVWSRSARRQRKPLDGKDAASSADTKRDRNSRYSDAVGAEDTDTSPSGDETREPALGFRIEVGEGEEKGGAHVSVRWLRGHDSVLFESFCGMVKRLLGENGEKE